MARYGALGAGLISDALKARADALADGGSTNWSDLAFNPVAVKRFTNELARLRGAALKAGQLISMDTSGMLPPELAEAATRLRAAADPMPARQLRRVLDERWGGDWLRRFKRFEVRPVAAASIGQVHKAETKDGRTLAIKVLYPGVRQSIDSDLDALGALLAVSGLVPRGMDLKPLLNEAKRQLHRETNYALEADNLHAYCKALRGDERFRTPAVADDWCADGILAMEWLDGRDIETVAQAPAAERERVFDLMLELTVRELFELGLMQTDPNFANFLYAGPDAPIGLIDFGAVQSVAPEISDRYRSVLRAALEGERSDLTEALRTLGVIATDTPDPHAEAVTDMAERSMAPIRAGAAFDFTDTKLLADTQASGESLRQAGFNHAPPPDLIFIQRKIGGLYLLGARLGMSRNLRPALNRYLA
jgi:predicted unusual protein kinase regulating ubiquinone biosynthesis (AarF/ABC1/UbiB family)